MDRRKKYAEKKRRQRAIDAQRLAFLESLKLEQDAAYRAHFLDAKTVDDVEAEDHELAEVRAAEQAELDDEAEALRKEKHAANAPARDAAKALALAAKKEQKKREAEAFILENLAALKNKPE